MWSETYHRKMQDIFAIQDDIAHAVVHRLNIGLRDEDANRPLVAQETGNPEATASICRDIISGSAASGHHVI